MIAPTPCVSLDADLCYETDEGGENALHFAARLGAVVTMRVLIEGQPTPETRRAYVNSVNIGGWTALMHASCRGHADVVAYLLNECGADQKLKNNLGRTALDIAREGNHTPVVRLLKPKRGVFGTLTLGRWMK